MKKIFPLGLVTLVLVAPAFAAAASTAELKVTGTMIPGVCAVTFAGSNSASIDYGRFDLSNQVVGAPLYMEKKSTPFEVSCSSEIKVALKVMDERAATSVAGDQAFGLGSHGERKLGSYTMRLMSVTADGAGVSVIQSNTGSLWESGEIVIPGSYMSWSSSPAGMPIAAKTVTGQIEVAPAVSAPNDFKEEV